MDLLTHEASFARPVRIGPRGHVLAQKAYETALHLFQRLSLGSAERARFEEKALHLKGLFERLGLNP
jgi:hypothetical protein